MDNENLLRDLEKEFKSLGNIRNMLYNDEELKSLIGFLLERSVYHKIFQKIFFSSIGGALIFKKDEFLQFLNLHILSGSYTKFSNKIGLSVNDKLLKTVSEVVLNFPFKDCVLKGAQSKDDDKNKEIFFNEILANNAIDVLFSKKVLYNFQSINRALKII